MRSTTISTVCTHATERARVLSQDGVAPVRQRAKRRPIDRERPPHELYAAARNLRLTHSLTHSPSVRPSGSSEFSDHNTHAPRAHSHLLQKVVDARVSTGARVSQSNLSTPGGSCATRFCACVFTCDPHLFTIVVVVVFCPRVSTVVPIKALPGITLRDHRATVSAKLPSRCHCA